MNEDGLLTYSEVAELLQVSDRSARRLVARKKLRVVNLGHRTKRFRRVDVARLASTLCGDRLPEM